MISLDTVIYSLFFCLVLMEDIIFYIFFSVGLVESFFVTSIAMSPTAIFFNISLACAYLSVGAISLFCGFSLKLSPV